MPAVQNDRAKNSAIHKYDKARYWKEIGDQLREKCVMELRLNVGGDLDNEDFNYVAELGKQNPRTMILFFTVVQFMVIIYLKVSANLLN